MAATITPVGSPLNMSTMGGLNIIPPQVMPKLYRPFGSQSIESLIFVKQLFGGIKKTSAETLDWGEENKFVTHFTFLTATTHTNTLIVSTIAAADIDSNNKYYPKVGHRIRFKKADGGAIGRISAIDVTNPAVPIFTINNISTTVNFPADPSGYVAMNLGYVAGDGTGNKSGHVSKVDFYQNLFEIFQEGCNTTDQAMATEIWFKEYDGKPLRGFSSKLLAEAEYRHMLAEANSLFKGTKSAGVVFDTDRAGNQVPLNFMEGFGTSIEDRGMDYEYTAGMFDVQVDFDAMARKIREAMCDSTFFLNLYGLSLKQDVTRGAVEFSKNSTIFTKIVQGLFQGNEQLALSFNFSQIGNTDLIHIINDFGILSNPNSYGADADMSQEGYIIPINKMMLPGQKSPVDSMSIYTRAGNGTDLEYSYIKYGGMTENPDQFYDEVVQIRSTKSVMLPCAKQCIHIYPNS